MYRVQTATTESHNSNVTNTDSHILDKRNVTKPTSKRSVHFRSQLHEK